MTDQKIIGYTTGVFDLFHIGHLNILRNAKSLCDYLIVGVTTDEEVQRVKNKTPIIPFEERKKIVEAIKYVDEVVDEKDVDKYKAWEKYKFDVIIKGSDWKNSERFAALEPKFKEVGVKIVFFEYTAGTSSTYLRSILEQFIKDDNKNDC